MFEGLIVGLSMEAITHPHRSLCSGQYLLKFPIPLNHIHFRPRQARPHQHDGYSVKSSVPGTLERCELDHANGRIIRVPIPELSEERRKDLTKVANRMGEEARVALRAIRRDGNDAIKALQKAASISEDDRDRALAEVQKYTDSFSKKADEFVAAKEKDIMAV